MGKKVFFIASEAQPYIASGGLGDVIGSLPKAIAKASKDQYEVSVVLPLYGKIDPKVRKKMIYVGQTNISLSWRRLYCAIYKIVEKGVTYYFIDNEYYFKRDRLYGYFDDAERFAYFSKASIDFHQITNIFPGLWHKL